MKITESTLKKIIREALVEFEKPENWNDTEINGAYTDNDMSEYEDVSDEDLLAYADEVDGNPDLMLGKLYRMNENQLVGLIRESIKKTVLNESKIYGYTLYCPAERDLGINWEELSNDKLTDLMDYCYEIDFRGYPLNNYSVRYVDKIDDNEVIDAINEIKEINPELGAAVETDYHNFLKEIERDSYEEWDTTIEWDWERAIEDARDEALDV